MPESHVTSSPPPASPSAEEEAPPPAMVGNTFMRQYYQFLAKEPQSLHRFYKDESRWCHGVGSQMEEPIAGQRAINEQILKRGYAGARVDLDAGSIDCQKSQSGGVLVLVTGVMTLRHSPAPKPFVQTFFLAVQPKGYFVLNDCLRFLELPGGAAPVDVAEMSTPENAVSVSEAVAAPTPAPQAAIGTPAPASPTRNGAKTPVPASPAAPPVASPKKAASPVKAATPTPPTAKSAPKPKDASKLETAPPSSPVKATATSSSSPVKKAAAKPTAAQSPVAAKSPVKTPTQENPELMEPAKPAEPEKPKTWAQLFVADKSAAAIAPSSGAGASAPAKAVTAKPSTPKASAPSAATPTPSTPTPSAPTSAPSASPKQKASGGKEGGRPRYFSLFIKDVPPQTRDQELRELFKGYGSIAGVNIVNARGYAFVDYYEQESMRAALAETAEFRVQDKLLQVEERSERKEGQRGGFRGGDARGRGRGHGPKGGRGDRGERKERSGDDTAKPRRDKSGGNRRGGKVDAVPHPRAE